MRMASFGIFAVVTVRRGAARAGGRGRGDDDGVRKVEMTAREKQGLVANAGRLSPRMMERI